MKRSLLAAIAAVLLCTACAPTAPTGPVSSSATASVSPTAPASLSAGGRSQAPDGTVPPTSGIAWDEESKTEAAGVASRAMADYARPGTEATRWANDFARWLTPQATADYSMVDPANVPVSRVTGPATLAVDESNGYGVTVTVPTDVGPYAVQLLRTSAESTWKVNRLTPPAS
ncbi:hypothetical protein [Arthrobacter sp. ISL-72]|uniref:hypothetical protein n=1 Tax=Arthrobacter sp. ISL-72 TaxID=2819114 RepID=UPI001BE8FB54|nr:hypothetical protein [Arthrobacter sp. ISL-72]MBT2594054.1 hypothetical protein [Arthrobacter sp. ISL-72]